MRMHNKFHCCKCEEEDATVANAMKGRCNHIRLNDPRVHFANLLSAVAHDIEPLQGETVAINSTTTNDAGLDIQAYGLW